MILLRKYIKKLILLEKITLEDFEDIEATARLAHMGQKRRDGSEYISHPLAVKSITKKYYPENFQAQVLALLHDVLEDGPEQGHVTEEELRDFIRGSISDPRDFIAIEIALDLMTHNKSTHPVYSEYLQRVFSNDLAAIVKISDLIHNLSHNPSERQILKYRSALKEVPIPSHIAPQHRKKLEDILK